ncbi:TIP41-like protein [Trinorchestia longiramus]|nr:TIP41-like protein [Trinorchestia longiramus]
MAAPRIESCQFGPWKFISSKSCIMGSKCDSPNACKTALASNTEENLCELCRFDHAVAKEHLPDMIFNKNCLRIEHASGAVVEFNALDALRELRDTDEDNIQVAHAHEWKEARKDCEYTQNVQTGYDWTYTTNYSGTLSGGIQVQPTDSRIDLDKLRAKEDIRFFQELYLYEDELDDNGASNCVVKIRCMDSGFLVLLRHYLRVDHVLLRVKETRLYHASGTDCIIRERATKRKPFQHLNVSHDLPAPQWVPYPLINQRTMDVRGLHEPPVDVRGLHEPPVDVRGLHEPPVDVRGLHEPPVDVRGLHEPPELRQPTRDLKINFVIVKTSKIFRNSGALIPRRGQRRLLKINIEHQME